MPLNINNTDTAICPGTTLDINLYGSDPNASDLLNLTLINSNLNGSNFNITITLAVGWKFKLDSFRKRY